MCVCVCVCVYVCSVRACVYGCDRGSDSEPALNPEGRTSGGHVIQHTVRVGPRREGERDERRRGCYLMGKAKGGSDRLTQRNGRSPQADGIGWERMGDEGDSVWRPVWACLTLSFSAHTAHRCTDSVGSTRVRRRSVSPAAPYRRLPLELSLLLLLLGRAANGNAPRQWMTTMADPSRETRCE
ncbi:hypothetical protein LY76DRAFT_359178 [Colletotrichum caudatum]|nr:hypothetical protein LY76DRAFT_359178 [Colletotrichum caudatum]